MSYTKGKLIISSSTMVITKEGKVVAITYPYASIPELDVGLKEAIANAEHLVKCWNSHDALLTACKEIEATVKKKKCSPYFLLNLIEKISEQAIAKARGKD